MPGFNALMGTLQALYLLERDRGLRQDLEESAQAVEDRWRGMLGIEQGAVGEWEAWEPLAESTQAARTAEGYTPDEPLLRSEQMSRDLTHTVYDGTLVADIGIPLGAESATYAWAMEKGTLDIGGATPPRAAGEPALYLEWPDIQRRVGLRVRAVGYRTNSIKG